MIVIQEEPEDMDELIHSDRVLNDLIEKATQDLIASLNRTLQLVPIPEQRIALTGAALSGLLIAVSEFLVAQTDGKMPMRVATKIYLDGIIYAVKHALAHIEPQIKKRPAKRSVKATPVNARRTK